MRYQDHIIETTKTCARDAFKYASKVPADKLEWKPLDAGRSVLDMCREMAQCAGWSERILKGEPMPEFNEEAMAKMQEMQSQWTTVEACEEVCNKNLEAFYAAVKDFPDEKLNDTYVLPFDGGQTIDMKQNMEYPKWNFAYHQGQIAYIQTLYGDNNMYWS